MDHFQDFGDAGTTHRAQAIQKGAADVTTLRAQCASFQNILTATNPAIHVHLNLFADRINNRGQALNAGLGAIELTTAMVATIIDLDWIKYNCKKATDNKNIFKKITYKLPEEFMDIVDQRSSDDSKIVVINDPTGIKLNIYNDRAPQYFTSFDDEYLIFDAYDSAIENNLQSIKTQCFGKRATTFTLDDNFVPDMPVQMFSYLLNEAKSTAFLVLKQMPNQKAEQVSVSQKRRMSQEAWRLKNGISYPNYGRK